MKLQTLSGGRIISYSTTAAVPPMKITPLGKPDAPVEGTFYRAISAEPGNFNPIASSEYASRQVYEYAVEGLLWLNPETYEFEPQLVRYGREPDFDRLGFGVTDGIGHGLPHQLERVKMQAGGD